MNSSSIDSLLKVNAPAAKPGPTDAPRDRGEFEKHLREATTPAPVTVKPTPKPKTADEATENEATVVAGDQEQNAAADSEHPPVEETEGSEVAVVIAEQEVPSVEPDEVLLSVAAISAQEGVITVTTPAVVTEEIVVATNGAIPEEGGEQNQTPATGTQLPASLTEKTAGQIPASEHLPDDAAKSVATTHEAVIEPKQAAAQKSTGEVATTEAKTAEFIAEQQPLPAAIKPAVAPAVATTLNSPVPAPKPNQPVAQPNHSEPGESEETSRKPAPVEKPVAVEKSVIDAPASVTELLELSDKTEAHSKLTVEAASPVPSHQTPNHTHSIAPTTESQLAQVEAVTREPQDADAQMPTIDRARFVQRVTNAFRSAQQNDGHIQLRLSPPELGSLKIEIAVRHGVLTANLETETADARRVLLDNLPALRHRLAEQDIRIEKFEVDIRREGGQSDGQTGAQDRQTQQQSQRAAAQNRIRAPQPTEVLTARVPRPTSTVADTNLDVRI